MTYRRHCSTSPIKSQVGTTIALHNVETTQEPSREGMTTYELGSFDSRNHHRSHCVIRLVPNMGDQ